MENISLNQVKEYLRNNLTIKLDNTGSVISVKLLLENEVIDIDYCEL